MNAVDLGEVDILSSKSNPARATRRRAAILVEPIAHDPDGVPRRVRLTLTLLGMTIWVDMDKDVALKVADQIFTIFPRPTR